MKKRWIIRSIFIGLLTLCAVAWVGSYFVWMSAGRDGSVYNGVLVLEDGALGLMDYDWTLRSYGANWGQLESSHIKIAYRYRASAHHWGGFAYQPSKPPFINRVVIVPMWWLTLLAGGLLALVWRVTRVRKPGGAFPVEPAKAEGRLP